MIHSPCSRSNWSEVAILSLPVRSQQPGTTTRYHSTLQPGDLSLISDTDSGGTPVPCIHVACRDRSDCSGPPAHRPEQTNAANKATLVRGFHEALRHASNS
ncbi:hypothetical protein [Photorhabdus antumapuensis]|uniref:hypothetical protein n=1 Tax=Photorhabdus antumapuensis TaxID=2862867 RepID=UPI001CEC0E6C|nr:hypothetical protein [Photorhabdus antumapuensis]MCA6221497.1 hypothetical protein [Photorhabdus antumapuensis]